MVLPIRFLAFLFANDAALCTRKRCRHDIRVQGMTEDTRSYCSQVYCSFVALASIMSASIMSASLLEAAVFCSEALEAS